MHFFGDLAQWWKVHHVGDIADWWDGRREEVHTTFERQGMMFVSRHPNAWGIAVAGTEQTLLDFSMLLGAGFVDVLRLGRGVREGTVKGFAQDGLRVLSIVPFGTLARWAQTGRGISALRIVKVVTDPFKKFGICTTVAATQALQMVNIRHAVIVEDLLRVAGIDLSVGVGMLEENIGGRFISELVPTLKKFGAAVTRIDAVKTIAELETVLRKMANSRGVMIFSAEWKMYNQATRTMKPASHTMLAFIDETGVFRIADRTGEVVTDLKALGASYPSIGKAVPVATSMAFIENAAVVRLAKIGKMVEGSVLNMLELEVKSVPLLTSDPAHAATLH